MVDCVIEIPLPGRTLLRASADDRSDAACVAVPAFFAGPENQLLAGAVDRLLPPASGAPPVLAIFGASGTGKSHLLRGLVRCWHDRCGVESAEYFAASDFRRDLTDAIRGESVVDFRRRVRSRQLLAIDDLDRLPGADYLQDELRHTLDACEESGSTVVVASARPVSSLRALSAAVRSRLASGLELRLAPPDQLARESLVRTVSAALGLGLTDEAAVRFAGGVAGTANDLFGALFELYSDRRGRERGDVPWVSRYLASRDARRPTFREILPIVARYYGVSQKVLKSSSRQQSAVFARAMAVYLARELSGLSYERIGTALGGRDHSTIMHNYRKIAQQAADDLAARAAIDELCHLLGVTPLVR